MTRCRCLKPRFTLHLQDRPKDISNPMALRCCKCGGLPKKVEEPHCKKCGKTLDSRLWGTGSKKLCGCKNPEYSHGVQNG